MCALLLPRSRLFLDFIYVMINVKIVSIVSQFNEYLHVVAPQENSSVFIP